MPRRRYLLTFLPAAIVLVAAGCGGSSTSSGAQQKQSTQSSGMMADTGAKLTPLGPASGTTVTGNSVATDVSIKHFRVACQYAGKANRMGIGHLHIELDRSLINMFCGPKNTISLQNVQPGRHTLAFIPAEDDHADDMKAAKSVSFVYKPKHALPKIGPARFPGKPSIRIVSPQNGATVHSGFDLVVAVKNFHLSCALYGKPNVAGYGHWHANVDSATKGMMGMGTMLGMSCAPSFHVSLASVKPGQHRFFAILEDNQHAPTPHAMASVTLNVQ